MDCHQIADVNRVARLVDADRARFWLDDKDRSFGDAGDRAGAVAGGPEDRDVLSAVQTVVAAPIEHHHVAGRPHLAALIPEHQVARVCEVRFT